jgi:hypothetical protein
MASPDARYPRVRKDGVGGAAGALGLDRGPVEQQPQPEACAARRGAPVVSVALKARIGDDSARGASAPQPGHSTGLSQKASDWMASKLPQSPQAYS